MSNLEANAQTLWLDSDHITASFYEERTDRNIGWITREEQEMLHKCTIGIAGCGGMGGLLAITFARLGIGTIKIADSEVFDVSNLNRQFAATTASIGISKATETARRIREISPDTKIRMYPSGITSESAAVFIEDCDIVCDEIEFWAIGSRILLHHAARVSEVPVVTCSSVGFGSRLFLFTRDSFHIEEALGLSSDEAHILQAKLTDSKLCTTQIQSIMNRVLKALIPELPGYQAEGTRFTDRDRCLQRLKTEQCASIIATNPPFASGFVANVSLLFLLEKYGFPRTWSGIPKAPGYLLIDSALMVAKRIEK